MNVRRLIYSDFGNILIPVILGFGLASLFRKVCKGRECIVFHAAPMNKIKEQIFKFNNKCYVYDENPVPCRNNKQIVNFA